MVRNASSPMNILILGNASDAHAVHVKRALEQTGATVHYWDTQQFPTQLHLSWQPHTGLGQVLLPDGTLFKLEEIHSIFWRNFSGVQIPSLEDADQYRIAFYDAMSTLRSLFQVGPAQWVNSWQAYQFHKEKPLQLRTAQQLGVTIPATLISNDPSQVIEFAHQHEQVIFKPVYGGAHTQLVRPDHLQPERLQQVLRLSPVTIQEYIAGTNIRSFVIGQTVYSAEICSTTLDFRDDQHTQLIPLAIPESIEAQCLAIANAFFLKWTAIDWRRTPAGDYVFLEANPSPMFLYFEQQTGFPITQALVTLLRS